MPIQTAQTYHENEDLHGGYQFITLKSVVDQMLLRTTDSENYLANTKRSLIVMQLKDVLQELTHEVQKNIKAVERTVGPSLRFPLEQDYVDWVSVSLVGEDFKLYPLNINNDIPTAISHLQDSNYNLLFDSEGNTLNANGINAYGKPYKKYSFCFHGSQGNLDTSKLSMYGEFVIDKKNILFSSDLLDKEVVIHYLSDGLELHNLKEEEIEIPKMLKTVLTQWAYFNIISERRTVPANEKERAKKAYQSSLHKAKIQKSNFSLREIFRLA
ncbi:virion structural protein [Cellulophaga phage phi18:3]|uniref:Structural protein n=1 Tax=Cellulophaga phage phi18:3 TaxID=1327983 RepID=S0A1F3_9CAUD|nr:virion structural protein [Cellulophaga phage phi18:3]AGO48625.1 structural protein [Cellulophaga phage phi18:3]